MNVRIQTSALAAILARVAPVADGKSTLPVLATVLLRAADDGALGGALSVVATDLTAAITATERCDVVAPGRICLDAKRLGQIVASLPGESATIEAGPARTIIKAGRSKFEIVHLPPTDYPKVPEPPDGAVWVAMKAASVLRLLGAGGYSISEDATRYHLSGVYFEKGDGRLGATSTDGHRLSHAEEKCEQVPALAGSIVPREFKKHGPRLLAKAESCEVHVGEKHLFLRVGSAVLSVKFVDAQFPPWEQIAKRRTDGTSFDVVADRDALLGAVRRCVMVASARTIGCCLSVEGNMLTVSVNDADTGSAVEEMEADVSGRHSPARFDTGINHAYLLDALDAVSGKRVTLAMSGVLEPLLVFDNADESAGLSVIMPMRL